MENLFIDYDRFRELCYVLLDSVKGKRKSCYAVLCPLRGGFYLSDFMSRHLNLPIIYIEITSYNEKKEGDFVLGYRPELESGRILLCDDIYDTGRTIGKIQGMYPHVEFETVCLVSKKKDVSVVYGCLTEKDRWVDFFWEVM